jgi:uncharacterized membrane protein
MIASLIHDLRQPEYVHVLINPLPVYGLAMGVIGLIIALIQRSRRAQIVGLTIIILTAAMAWPVAYYGEEGYDRVLSMSDDTGQAWLKVHAHRVDQFIWFFYALALIAAAAIFAPLKWPRASAALTSLTLLLALIVLGMGGYIAHAGGKIRHKEFRHEPPPPVPVEQDEH